MKPVVVVEVETPLAVADAVEALLDVRASLLTVAGDALDVLVVDEALSATAVVPSVPVVMPFVLRAVAVPEVTPRVDDSAEPPSKPPGFSAVTVPPHPTAKKRWTAAATIGSTLLDLEPVPRERWGSARRAPASFVI